MARAWQEHGKHVARSWRQHGKSMGKSMARAWQEHGKNMASTWQDQVQIPLSVKPPPAKEVPAVIRQMAAAASPPYAEHAGSAAAQGAASPPHAAPAAAQGASSPPHAVEYGPRALYRRNGLLSTGIVDRRGDRYVVSQLAQNEAIDAVPWFRHRALQYHNLPLGAILPYRVRSLKSFQYPVIGCG